MNNPKKVNLKELFKDQLNSLLAKHEGFKHFIDHQGMKGDANENMWIGFLRDFLPERYAIDTGKAIDHEGHVSHQIDVIIYDRHYSPLIIKLPGDAVYVPAESIYAALEVKSELNKGNLKYTGDKVESVRKLKRTAVPIPIAGGKTVSTTIKPILGGLLCGKPGWSPPFGKKFSDTMSSLTGTKKVNFGIAIGAGYFESDSSGNIGVHDGDGFLMRFLIQLLGMLQSIGTISAIDYSKYAENIDD